MIRLLPKVREVIDALGCTDEEFDALPKEDRFDLLEAYSRSHPRYASGHYPFDALVKRLTPAEPLPDHIQCGYPKDILNA